MRQKIDVGSGLVAAGAVLLFISLFLDWYKPALSAFDAFEVVDWALAALAVLIVAGVAIAWRDGATPRWLLWAVGAAVLLVAAQVIDPPPAARNQSRDTGAWLAVGGALVMAGGLLLAATSISVTVDVRGRERRRRVAAVDRREATAAAPPPPPPPPPPRGRDPERTQPLRPLEPRPPGGERETPPA